MTQRWRAEPCCKEMCEARDRQTDPGRERGDVERFGESTLDDVECVADPRVTSLVHAVDVFKNAAIKLERSSIGLDMTLRRPDTVERFMHDRSSMKWSIASVRRRCLVCEAEMTVNEPENTEPIGTPCQECSAPTERVAVLAVRKQELTSDANAAALGRLGGLKGGKARAAALSPARRREIARLAARRRWGHR